MLTIYAPFNNKKSKAWEVFDGVKQSWPEQVNILDNNVATEPLANSMYWGFVEPLGTLFLDLNIQIS